VSPFYAILLGIIQGLTEFLPISSTAHLTIAGSLLGLIDRQNPQSWTEYIAVIQLGTLAAVIVYFFRDILAILFKDAIEGLFTKNLVVISSSLVILAALLWVAEKAARHQRTMERLTWVDALIIGFAQACALVPGSSRSGTTITAGLFLGLTRETAARFSFLLSIPAVFASGLFELSKIHASVFALGMGNLVIGTIVAALSGYAAIAWLLRYLMKRTTMAFVWYRLGAGIILMALLMFGVIQP